MSNKLLDMISEEELVGLYQLGLSTRDIAVKYNISEGAVRKAKSDYGIELIKNKLLEMISEEELRKLVLEDRLTLRAVAKEYNVAVSTAKEALKILGIELIKENKLLRVISKEELENLLLIEELSPNAIAKIYGADRDTVIRLMEFFNIEYVQGNKLLRKITEEELRDLLFNKYMTPTGICNLYGVDSDTVRRAIDILGIELDKEIWYKGSSPKQRELLSKGTKLTDRQHQIIVGNLLGDGSICKSGKSASFSIAQSISHKKYIDWLYEELLPFSMSISENSYKDKNGKEFYSNWLSTISTPEFLEYNNLFYPNDVKIVPKDISNRLTDLSLAVWFMDDGSTDKDTRTSCLCTQGFTVEDVNFLISILDKKFGIRASLRYSGLLPKIYINGVGYDTFHSIVDSLLQPCFSYKKVREKKVQMRPYGELHSNSKLTEDTVREIRKLFLEGLSRKELAVKYNVVVNTIQSIVLNRTWKHVT